MGGKDRVQQLMYTSYFLTFKGAVRNHRMNTLDKIIALINDPWIAGMIATVLGWLGWKNKAVVSGLWAKIAARLPSKKPTPQGPSKGTGEINEASLAGDERHLMFYHVEQIRKYAEETSNAKAVENCIALMNDLFRVYPKSEG